MPSLSALSEFLTLRKMKSLTLIAGWLVAQLVTAFVVHHPGLHRAPKKRSCSVALQKLDRLGVFEDAPRNVVVRDSRPTDETLDAEYVCSEVCTFGAHRGESVRDIPLDYINWCRNQENPQGGMKALIRAYDHYHNIRYPSREFICLFGRYKNVPLGQIPRSYIQWCQGRLKPKQGMKDLINAYCRMHCRTPKLAFYMRGPNPNPHVPVMFR